MNNIVQGLREYLIFFKYWVGFLVFGAFFRVLLMALFIDEFNIDAFLSIAYGFRMDTIEFSYFAMLCVILYTFNFIKTVRVVLTTLLAVHLFMEFSTIPFMNQFFTRPNYLFIEHFRNIGEIVGMVWEMNALYIMVSVPLLLFICYKFHNFFSKTIHVGNFLGKLILLPFVGGILFLGARSSLGTSTPNPGFYSFSNSSVHNEIANNSVFSILYAVYLLDKEKFYDYGQMEEKEALANVKTLNGISHKENNLNRVQTSVFAKKKNIILVMLESFGHEFVGHLGGTPTTPYLDQLREESLYFNNLYAVGTRTSWGVSSVLTSLYPIPSREYVKAAKSQKDFYTVAKTLKNHGYESTFLYSGDADFDNMKGFMLANGFDKVMGKESFDDKLTKYTWGYSDEDLYDKAVEMIEQKPKDEPYFLTLLTLSSHEPFDYPKGKVEPYAEAKLEGFANSIKYADYALGKFIQQLKDKGLMENTIVAFVADHNNSAYGTFDVPIDKYKIPALIVSDDFKGGKEYNKVASQIDFMPTVLDVAGISDTVPTMGASVLKVEKNAALLLYDRQNFAYMLEDQFIIYKGNKNVQTYDYQHNKIKSSPERVKEGLSYIYGSKYLYEHEGTYDIKKVK